MTENTIDVEAATARKKEIDADVERMFPELRARYTGHELSYLLSKLLGKAHASDAVAGHPIEQFMRLSDQVQRMTMSYDIVKHLAERLKGYNDA